MTTKAKERAESLLFVDDEANVLNALKRLFRPLGYRILTARNGAEGLSVLESEHIDLLISDMRMPVMDGAAFLQQAATRWPEVVRFLLTGYSDLPSVAAAVNQGHIFGYLNKPWDDGEIKRVVQQALEQKAHREKLERRRERLEYEQEVVTRLFVNLYRPSFPDTPELRFLLAPLETSSGDLLLAARPSPQKCYFLLGDFTGHGLSAAVGALPTAELFHAMATREVPLDTLAAGLNRRLEDILPAGMFLSAALLELDGAQRRLSVWNGGLPDLLVCGHSGVEARFVSQHLPLGILDPNSFDAGTETVALNPGTRVYLYTDGIVDAEDCYGERFGGRRLEQALTEGPIEEAFERVERALGAFRDGAAQLDDLTLVELLGECRRSAVWEPGSGPRP